MSNQEKYLIVIAGPTAVGKTQVTIKLAQCFQSEILSADSRQIYKELHIGTAKPSKNQLSSVKHHFINHKSISDDYDAGQYQMEARALLTSLFLKHKAIFVTGGTGLYIKAVVDGLDTFPPVPEEINIKWENRFQQLGLTFLQQSLKELDPVYYDKVDTSNHRRLLRALMVCDATGKPFSSFLNQRHDSRDFIPICILLKEERKVLYDRINTRVDQMIADGLVNEAEALLPYRHLKALQTVGYQELFDYFDGNYTLEEAIEKIKIHSRRYAKRQMTWFRNQGSFVEFDVHAYEALQDYISEQIEG